MKLSSLSRFFGKMILGAICFYSATAYAQDTELSGINLEFYRPATDPYGFFGVAGPRLLQPGTFYLDVSQSFTQGPVLQVAAGAQILNIVDRLYTTNLLASIGINPLVNLSIDVPLHLYAKETNFNTGTLFTTTSLGDIRATLKIKLLEGLALLVSNNFPTGSSEKFVSDGAMSPGVTLAAGKDFRYVKMATNVGAEFIQGKNVLGVGFDDRITYGVGAQFPFSAWDPLLSLMGEIRGHFEPRDHQLRTSPVEFMTGLRKEFQKGLILQTGIGGAWNNTIGNPRIRGVASLSYLLQTHHDAKKIKPEPSQASLPKPQTNPPEQPQVRLHTTLYCGSDQVQPTQESFAWLAETLEAIRSLKQKVSITVEGHTDKSGRTAFNQILSEHRALFIKDYLIKNGINPEWIQSKGLGETQPATPNASPLEDHLNRRVEIFIYF